MTKQVYLLKDSALIAFVEENDIEGFKDYLSEEEYLYLEDPEEFDTEKQALEYCARIGKGMEGYPTQQLPLRSFEEYDQPFIEAIKSY